MFDVSDGAQEDAAQGDGRRRRFGRDCIPARSAARSCPSSAWRHFSFNKPAGACPTCTGLGTVHTPNIDRLVDQTRTIRDGAILGWEQFHFDRYISALQAAGRHYGFTFDATLPINQLGEVQRDLLFYGVNGRAVQAPLPQHQTAGDGARAATSRAWSRISCAATPIKRHDANYREKLADFVSERTCPDCHGTRLKAESRRVTVLGQTIIDVSQTAVG